MKIRRNAPSEGLSRKGLYPILIKLLKIIFLDRIFDCTAFSKLLLLLCRITDYDGTIDHGFNDN